MTKTIEIEILERFSTNTIYSGVHFSVRKRHKDFFGWLVKKGIKKSKIEPIKNFPVDLFFTFGMKGKLYDSSNCSYMAKLIEDWLVRLKIFPDDSPKYVRWCASKSIKSDRDICLLEIRET